MSLQVQNAYSAFSRYKKDVSDVSQELILDWCNNIYWYIYRRITKQTPDQFMLEYEIPYVSGITQYALPSDFGNLKSFGTGIYPVDKAGVPAGQTIPYSNFGSNALGYYLNNNNIIFTPRVGNLFSYNPILRYVSKPFTLTSLDDYFTLDGTSSGQEVISLEFRDYVVKALDVFYSQWDEDPGAESTADFRFVRIMNDLLTDIRKTPSVFGIDGQMNNF